MLLALARWGVPAVLVAVGIAYLVLGDAEDADAIGLSAIGVALLVLLFNLGLRLSIASGSDRDKEEQARRHFSEHGEWPEEEDSLETTGRRPRPPG